MNCPSGKRPTPDASADQSATRRRIGSRTCEGELAAPDVAPLSPRQVDQIIALRQKVGGTLDYFAHAEGLRQGPSSLDELCAWPETMLSNFIRMPGGGLRLRRILSLLEDGAVIHTDCSGRMTPETALQMLDIALKECGAALPDGWCVFWRSCDSAPACQTVMAGARCRPQHIFKGLLTHLPEEEQREVEARRPPRAAPIAERAEAFASMRAYLKGRASSIYERSARSSSCLLHDNPAGCALSFRDPAVDDPRSRPITMAIAGTPCTPFSSFGNREELAHADMEAWALWSAEVFHQNYDVIYFENSDRFPLHLLAEALPPHYRLKYAHFGSHDLGFPVRRFRLYALAYNISTLVWAGDDDADITRELLARFGAATVGAWGVSRTSQAPQRSFGASGFPPDSTGPGDRDPPLSSPRL